MYTVPSKTMAQIALTIAALMLTACGDDGGTPSSSGACKTTADCTGGKICFDSECVTPTTNDVVGDTSAAEDSVTPTDGGPTPPKDVPTPKDTKPTPDPGPAPDLLKDTTPPGMKSISPADGTMNVAMPFQIAITFTEPVKNVEAHTVSITDVNGNKVEGTFGKNQASDVYTFTPKDPGILASPYRVTVNYPNQVIIDAAGNKMQGLVETTFFTAGPDGMEPYAALVSKYAPALFVGTQSATKAMFDFPTTLNVDGNWDITDNKAWALDSKTKKLTPAVHWAVLETESHYYVHYVYYFVARDNGEENQFFANDAAGALVVIEKWPEERPVEVLTWFKNKSGDYIRAFPTTESGIFEGDNDNEAVDDQKPQADLFPDGRFQAWIPAGKHESCLWNDEGQGNYSCDLPQSQKQFIDHWTLTAGAQATPIEKTGATWPVTGEGTYGLVDLLTVWWPRRQEYETLFWSTTTAYSHKDGTKNFIATFPRFFVSEQAEQGDGRTPFAVIWKPGDNKPYTSGLDQGMYFFDPPEYLSVRHKTAYFEAEFDAEAKTGFSGKWCFNPFLGIDNRGSSDVCP